MWVPCSRCACGWKAYTATGPDSPSDALLFSSCLISLKPVGVSSLPLQGAHDIVLSAVSICSFVRSLLHFVYCSDHRYSQVVIGLRCCFWKFIASPTSDAVRPCVEPSGFFGYTGTFRSLPSVLLRSLHLFYTYTAFFSRHHGDH